MVVPSPMPVITNYGVPCELIAVEITLEDKVYGDIVLIIVPMIQVFKLFFIQLTVLKKHLCFRRKFHQNYDNNDDYNNHYHDNNNDDDNNNEQWRFTET